MDFKKLIEEFKNCECGHSHETAVKDVRIGSGITADVGNILKENGFPKKLLLVADETTLNVAEGIIDALKDFDLMFLVYDELRVAKMSDVRMVEEYIDAGAQAVIAVGTGSIHDPCRLACGNKKIPLCLFATAPSMDGFASYSSPIVDNNFKYSYSAKSPEVIIGDMKILAAAPSELKSSGFGDMVAKYPALIDWQVSALVSGEEYCPKVAALTRSAIDRLMTVADKVTVNDEETAGYIFEGLLMTGLGMSFVKSSRPASGTEHIMAHYIECKELLENKIPNYHGEDVGVMTLIILRLYNSLLQFGSVKACKENLDWEKIKDVYGSLSGDMEKLNFPTTITDGIKPEAIEKNWNEIKKIISSVPDYEQVKEKMKLAGCKLTYKDIGKSKELMRECLIYHPYMRRRLSLKRLLNMTDLKDYADNFPLE